MHTSDKRFYSRRDFSGSLLAAGVAAATLPWARSTRAASAEPLFKISLAEWSLNKTLRARKMTNLDFPRVAKQEFGIDCIEFVDQFLFRRVLEHGNTA